MGNKQTAVEWLEEKINLYNFEVGMDSMRIYIEYAKQIEKEQIMKAYLFPNTMLRQTPQDYYNKTYGK